MFTKEYKLTQHTMLIHFQAGHTGDKNVCLRASEVKPKFDRFIVKKLGDSLEESWIQSRHTNNIDVALKYRMTISAGNVRIVPAENIPRIFYGNMNRPGEEKKNAVMFPDGVSVKITCMIPELLKKIDAWIGEFFAVTNFGTMQDRGFGSFAVDNMEVNIPEALKSNFDIEACYVVCIDRGGFENQNELFDTVKQIYSVMKSGQNIVRRDGTAIPSKYIRSFIYKYMHEHNLGNEKAWMKKEGIAPIRTTHEPENTHEHHKQKDFKKESYRYVRALLGIGKTMAWLEPETEQKNNSHSKPWRESIEIERVAGNPIERYASPVFFKIVGKKIYITANQPKPEIFGCEFSFINEGYIKKENDKVISPREGNGKDKSISTLSKEEGENFDMKDFLQQFMRYYNGNIYKLQNRCRMEEAR